MEDLVTSALSNLGMPDLFSLLEILCGELVGFEPAPAVICFNADFQDVECKNVNLIMTVLDSVDPPPPDSPLGHKPEQRPKFPVRVTGFVFEKGGKNVAKPILCLIYYITFTVVKSSSKFWAAFM
jgi:hypothetical protein